MAGRVKKAAKAKKATKTSSRKGRSESKAKKPAAPKPKPTPARAGKKGKTEAKGSSKTAPARKAQATAPPPAARPSKTSRRPAKAAAGSAIVPDGPRSARARRAPPKPPPPRKPSPAELARLQQAKELRESEERQTSQYDKAVEYFNDRRFDRALSYFEKAAEGPLVEFRHRAKVHAEICRQQRQRNEPKLKTAEEHYNYGVQLMNERRLDEAERHLERALKLEPKAGYLHFAAAVLGALSGNTEASYQSLKRAIQLDPQNRILALRDADLAPVVRQSPFAELLHEEGNSS
jgi:tetratricopeptide (TPR) repeat protein